MQAAKPIALVTGANRGLGQEVAKQLADLGYNCALPGKGAGGSAAIAWQGYYRRRARYL